MTLSPTGPTADCRECEAPDSASIPTVEDRLWTAASWPLIAASLTLVALIAFESFAVTTVLPVVARDLGGEHWYSFAFAGTLTAGLVAMALAGGWADRAGTNRPLLTGAGLFAAGLGMCVLAGDMAWFIGGRLLQGFGGGLVSVVIYALIGRHIAEGLRPRFFGLLSAAWLLPAMLGPVAAGAVTELWSWRVLFAAVLVGTAAASALLWLATARHGRAGTPGAAGVRRRTLAWAIAASLATSVLHVGGQQQGLWRLTVPAAAVVVVVAASRLLPRGTLRAAAGTPRLIALRGLVGVSATGCEVYLTLYLQEARGLSPTLAGWSVAVSALTWAAGSWWQGRRVGSRADDAAFIAAGVGLVLAGPAVVLAVVATNVPVGLAVIGWAIAGLGLGTCYPRISSATLQLAGAGAHGRLGAALQLGEGLSSALGLALLGSLLAVASTLTGGLVAVFAVLTLLAATAAVVAVRTLHSTRSAAPDTGA
ncbi:MFS transporter [Zhihengliuella halotolerans]|uniref:MFS transporter n=1 Tax=Zhihengliuella halotolerans TaxID=370736 RepID=UPI000C8004E1|nr:MFS transporter [Zhihengliuella halotolerans]